jgi:acetylornithine aminotransferase
VSDLLERWATSVMPTYGTPPLALVSGSGAVVRDDAGREYVDLVGGLAVNALGHAHPAVVEAVTRQVGTLGHVSNLVAHPTVVALAERLLGLFAREGRVFFCNSGAEANEAAFKLSRRTGRSRVVAAEGGFHGRTMGALALTGQPAKRDPFLPLPGDVVHVPYGDSAALAAAVDGATAAVVLEPVQGEAGVRPAPDGYLQAARAACDRHGALLVLDEVQTGVGRTGAWFAHQDEGVRPDVVTLAKGLGGGLPLGACIAFGEAAELLGPGQHGSTFGGNPVCCSGSRCPHPSRPRRRWHCGPPGSSSTRWGPTPCAWSRRWCSPSGRPTRSSPRCPAPSTRPGAHERPPGHQGGPARVHRGPARPAPRPVPARPRPPAGRRGPERHAGDALPRPRRAGRGEGARRRRLAGLRPSR